MHTQGRLRCFLDRADVTEIEGKFGYTGAGPGKDDEDIEKLGIPPHTPPHTPTVAICPSASDLWFMPGRAYTNLID